MLDAVMARAQELLEASAGRGRRSAVELSVATASRQLRKPLKLLAASCQLLATQLLVASR